MMSLLSVELISGYFLQPSRLCVQKYHLARKNTPLTNKLGILRMFCFDIGRGRTAIFRAKGGQSSFRSIATVCTRRRRKADVAENSFEEKIRRDQLVFLFFGPCYVRCKSICLCTLCFMEGSIIHMVWYLSVYLLQWPNVVWRTLALMWSDACPWWVASSWSIFWDNFHTFSCGIQFLVCGRKDARTNK
jgi:hypothetical protein